LKNHPDQRRHDGERWAGICESWRYLTAMSVRYRIFCFIVCIVLFEPSAGAHADAQPKPEVVTIDITPAHKIATFRPRLAIGSTVDKEPAGSIPALYSKPNIEAMLSAGLGWLSYRLFTELSDQDWHWNPAGTFSQGDAGYWTSNASTQTALISDSFGYRLPHSGNTTDQGNNEGYSRLDDGDPRTYWKSDPYLASPFTGDADTSHPQWVVIDLEQLRTINEVRILWGNPYALTYSIQTWTGDDPINDPGTGTWSTIAVQKARPVAHSGSGRFLGPVERLHVATPVTARYVRVLMTRSSNTCDGHGSADRRDCVGYAIAELSVGTIDPAGGFHDFVRHTPCGGDRPGRHGCGMRQTPTYVSSVDPWHSAADRVRNQEQPGLDLIARSGLTRGQPAMYPVAMLYSTPENAVNEVRYLRARGYPISFIELGEEPDGQYTTPEDDAALYVQWARALHRFEPTLKLGGPVFSGVNSELQTWPDATGNISWLNRFLNYLTSHRAMDQLAFMSFEHYPFNGCEHGAALQLDLLQEPSIIKGLVNTWRSDGLPQRVPLYITEANFSAVNFTQTPMQIEGALWQADYMASSLATGISGVVYYQYEPVPLSQNRQCPSDWGNLTMFVAGTHGDIRDRGAQFYASQMLMQQWLQPGDAPHDLYAASSNVMQAGYPLVTAYAVHRPDGLWSVLLVNKDTKAHDVVLEFGNSAMRETTSFTGRVTQVRFGPAQYAWRQSGKQSMPDPDTGLAIDTVDVAGSSSATAAPHTATYALPANSITVLRGTLGPVLTPSGSDGGQL